MWKLANKDEKALSDFMALSDKEIMAIPEEGDGKAVFFSEGTHEDYLEFQKEEEGMKPWYDRIKNL